MSHKTLFLQQSYEDCTRQYMEVLNTQKMPLWDYVILTASNESQAQSYRMQIQYRLEHGMLPKSIHYAVLPDPDGKRVGSGGATLNVLRYIYEDAGSFDDKRILVIHSGGDSKRVPQYSACGKLFSPVPRLLPNGRRSTLFDEFMISMCGVAARIRTGMLVCSGDVLLLFNPLQIDFYGSGAAALSIKEPAEIGKNHGVYRVDKNGNVGGFLHKKTVEQLHGLGATDVHGNVDIDTGAVIMDTELLKSLYQLVDTPENFDAYVNEKTRLSFYADFLYPLASESTLEQYYKETPEGDLRGTYEVQAIQKVHHIMGRTDWDRACTMEINPSAEYHFCNETLRPEFYVGEWNYEKCRKHSIFMSQGYNSIKGMHYMLEALNIIKRFYPDVKLYVTGTSPLSRNWIEKQKRSVYVNYLEKLIRQYSLENSIVFLGSLNAEEMKEQYLLANVFASPSSIENSPNSVGEAMILGTPVVSSDVGGVKNMLTHNEEGFLYQHDAPYMLAFYAMELFENKEKCFEFSKNAKQHAKTTHDANQNLSALIDIYRSIAQKNREVDKDGK